MIIHIHNKQKALNFKLDAVEKIVKQVLKDEKETCDEVWIYFVNTKKICELHNLYFSDPTKTDCISFPMDEESDQGYRILGEIFVCPAVAIEYAAQHGIDPYEELALYIIHGLLHLIGYDDIKIKDLAEMRKAERRHMDKIKKLNYQLKP